jgi:hypothetical protein
MAEVKHGTGDLDASIVAVPKQLTGQGALRVHMVTPRGKIADQDTDAVTAPGEIGEFEVLPGHVPMLSELHPGVLSLAKCPPCTRRPCYRGRCRRRHEIPVDEADPGRQDRRVPPPSSREGQLEEWTEPQNAAWKTPVLHAGLASRART